MNRVFIPALWNTDDSQMTSPGLSKGQVTAIVTSEVAKGTSDLVKVDGSRVMTGNLDFNQNDLKNVKTVLPPVSGDSIEIDGSFNLKNYDLENVSNIRNVQSLSAPNNSSLQINSNVDMNNYNLQNIQGLSAMTGRPLTLRGDVQSYSNINLRGESEIVNSKVPESDDGVARFKTVDNMYYSLENVFEKSPDHIVDHNRLVYASSQHTNWMIGDKAFDSDPKSQWVIGIAEASSKSWLKVKYTNSHSIYKIQLTARQPPQDVTHYVTRWTLFGSNDDNTYDYIFNAIANVTSTHTFEFKVSRPYNYFKFELEGRLQYGFSDVKLYPAFVSKMTPRFVKGGTNGQVPFIYEDVNGNMRVSSTSNLQLDDKGQLYSKTLGHVPFSTNINLNGHTLENLASPVISSDGVNKLYVDNKFLTKGQYSVSQALPGIPVINDLVMSFIASLTTCSINVSSEVISITDPLTGTILMTGTNKNPILQFDANYVPYIHFSGNVELFKDQVSVSDIGGATGKTTTFFLIAETKVTRNQSQFSWVRRSGSSWVPATRLGVHLPWGNSEVYIDHAAVSGGRMSKSFKGSTSRIINRKIIWSYRRNDKIGTVYVNGNFEHSVSNLTSAFNPSHTGRFTIGNQGGATNYCTMDFYGLFFYNRALSDIEMKQMHLYLLNKFKI